MLAPSSSLIGMAYLYLKTPLEGLRVNVGLDRLAKHVGWPVPLKPMVTATANRLRLTLVDEHEA